MIECQIVIWDVKQDKTIAELKWESEIAYLTNNKDAQDLEVEIIDKDNCSTTCPSKFIVFDTGTNLVIEYQEILI